MTDRPVPDMIILDLRLKAAALRKCVENCKTLTTEQLSELQRTMDEWADTLASRGHNFV